MNDQANTIYQAIKEERMQKINSVYSLMSEEIDLPSRGEFYPNGTSTVKIRPMTAKEEDLLSNERLLKSGKAFDQLIKACVIDWNGIEYDNLIIGDKNAILMAIRVISLGEEYDVMFLCPKCNAKTENTISLKGDLKYKFLSEEPLQAGKNEFGWTSPRGVKFKVKILTSKDQDNIVDENKKRKQMYKANYKESPTTDALMKSIISIEDMISYNDILDTLNIMPTSELRALTRFIKDLSPDYDLSYNYTCPECDEMSTLIIPINVNFFWPEGGSASE